MGQAVKGHAAPRRIHIQPFPSSPGWAATSVAAQLRRPKIEQAAAHGRDRTNLFGTHEPIQQDASSTRNDVSGCSRLYQHETTETEDKRQVASIFRAIFEDRLKAPTRPRSDLEQLLLPVREAPMAQQDSPLRPFTTKVLESGDGTVDALPASYHYYESTRRKRRIVGNPAHDVAHFLETELCLGILGEMLPHFWFAGSKHPAKQLHLQVAMGRRIVVADRMDLHLLWENDGRLFLKPVPSFLLDPDFWRRHLKCPDACSCRDPLPASCRPDPRRVALGFLYTYACLISSETDFFVANEKRLLPRKADDSTIEWAAWKKLARELLESHDPDNIHPRFLRAELRMPRINTIHRFTRLSSFDPYLHGRHNYSGFFRDNLAWMTAAAVFVALVLTAMQVGLATERLQGDAAFQQASFGFTVFAILGPVCAFGLVILVALFQLVKDLPSLVGDLMTRSQALPAQI
ncbi:hypothetical protein RB600_007057 [Gaeumannomyces tritici]